MQETTDIYKELLASDYQTETRLAIGETGVLITKLGEGITFGGVRILTGATGADGGYDETIIRLMETKRKVFSKSEPSVGDCISSQIDIEMHKPYGDIPNNSRLVPYVRLKSPDGKNVSEWIQKGVFYIDTRRKKEDGSAVEKIIIRGFDDMLKADQDYPSSNLEWPAIDIAVVREIAAFMGVSVDRRTVGLMTDGYRIQYPAGYSCREVLGYIAASYGGCFVMSDIGELRLVALWGIPKETRYLITKDGSAITFGGVRIRV